MITTILFEKHNEAVLRHLNAAFCFLRCRREIVGTGVLDGPPLTFPQSPCNIVGTGVLDGLFS